MSSEQFRITRHCVLDQQLLIRPTMAVVKH